MEGVERYKVRLLPHSEKWKKEYLSTKAEIENIFKDNIVDIQHVGSTAIKSICAKPILDVAVIINSLNTKEIESMRNLGYDFCGSRNKDNTYFLFVLRGENQISLKHIHCYLKCEREFYKLVKFRDYLNMHPDCAEQYAELKEKLAVKYQDDRFSYTSGKEEFINNVYMKINLEFAKSLETMMWEAAVNKDKNSFTNLVLEDAVMICGGYRCLGKEYAGYIEEGIASAYKFINFEIVYENEEIIQVHYVVEVEAFDDKNSECAGKFHVASTWQKDDEGYKLIFNMDSRIFE